MILLFDYYCLESLNINDVFVDSDLYQCKCFFLITALKDLFDPGVLDVATFDQYLSLGYVLARLTPQDAAQASPCDSAMPRCEVSHEGLDESLPFEQSSFFDESIWEVIERSQV